ncbi:MAG: sigma 54-interacting transcriptional regulator [Fibrobacterota bacterium]
MLYTLNGNTGCFPLTGLSSALQRVREHAVALAGTKTVILILGETGTGKEVLARHIHDISPRKHKPLIKIDCSSNPQQIIESDLFGHEAGAFEGATDRKIGGFEEAEGGTVFLDEIGNLDLRLQEKLLQTLQHLSIRRMGDTRTIPLDVRFILASNADLFLLVREGALLEELYLRISTATLTLPPLRSRKEDIPDLCAQFITGLNHDLQKAILGLTPGALQKLQAHDWPGNVRELLNVVRKACMFCTTDRLPEELLQIEPGPRTATALRIRPDLRAFDRGRMEALARRHSGCVNSMAAELGISRQSCYANLKKWNVDPGAFRTRKPAAAELEPVKMATGSL